MRRRTAALVWGALLFAGVALLAWPAFALVATVAGAITGEAWQLDAWDLEPKRRLLSRFVEGWIASAPFALGAGLIALVDHGLLGRRRRTRLVAGVLLPLAGAALAFALWPVPMDALPTLVATGLVLALGARVAHFVHRGLR